MFRNSGLESQREITKVKGPEPISKQMHSLFGKDAAGRFENNFVRRTRFHQV